LSYAITGIAGCCARAASGHAAAPPDSARHLASASHDYQPRSPGEEDIAKMHRDWQRKFDNLLHK
jgi:hypothetical protein